MFSKTRPAPTMLIVKRDSIIPSRVADVTNAGLPTRGCTDVTADSGDHPLPMLDP
jgi:hypothetical protein